MLTSVSNVENSQYFFVAKRGATPCAGCIYWARNKALTNESFVSLRNACKLIKL